MTAAGHGAHFAAPAGNAARPLATSRPRVRRRRRLLKHLRKPALHAVCDGIPLIIKEVVCALYNFHLQRPSVRRRVVLGGGGAQLRWRREVVGLKSERRARESEFI